MAYKLFVYHSEDNMIFFSHLTGGDAPLLQLISYFSSISLRVFTFVSSVAGSWCCWLPVWVVHLHSTEQVNSKATQRSSPSPFTKKKKRRLLKPHYIPPPLTDFTRKAKSRFLGLNDRQEKFHQSPIMKGLFMIQSCGC